MRRLVLTAISFAAGLGAAKVSLSKFLNMGMTLADVAACSTWHPAREIHHEELRSLSAGADVGRPAVGEWRFRI
jgi:predicted amidohydrolase